MRLERPVFRRDSLARAIVESYIVSRSRLASDVRNSVATTLLATLSLAAVSASRLDAREPPRHDAITTIIEQNQTLGRDTDARLEKERKTLEGLRELRRRGYASWLDVSRQEVRVGRLTGELDSVRRLDSLIRARPRAARAAHEVVDEPTSGAAADETDRAATPLKLRLPGSVRLFGWIESVKWDPRGRGIPEPALEPSWDVELARATYRVARAEWRAEGGLRAMEVELERARSRADSLGHLVSVDPTRAAELESQTRIVQEVEARLRQIRDGRGLLEQSFRELAARLDGQGGAPSAGEQPADTENDDDDASADDTERRRAMATWPAELPDDPAMIEHLLVLRRDYWRTVAWRDALRLELDHVLAHVERLERATRSASDSARPVGAPGDAGPWEISLRAGERRQRQALRLDVKGLEAEIRQANERLDVLALEDRRFLLQCARQLVLPVDVRGAWSRRGYLECRDIGLLLRLGVFPPAPWEVDLVRRDRCPPPAGCGACSGADAWRMAWGDWILGGRAWSYRRDFDRTASSVAGIGCLYRPLDYCLWRARQTGDWCDWRRRDRFSCAGRLDLGCRWRSTFRDPCYGDLYEFGRLRSELFGRCRTSFGRSPWYLPGSPD